MQFHPTTEQSAMINYAVASGRVRAPEEAISNALDLWLERERSRMELIAALDVAEADVAAERYREYRRDELPQLFEELKSEGRARLQAKKAD